MAGRPTTRFRIQGMDCGSCALTIEQAVGRLAGVRSVRVDFTTEMLEAESDTGEELIAQRVRDLGYRVLPGGSRAATRTAGDGGLVGFIRFLWQHGHTRVASLVAVALLLLTGVWFSVPAAPASVLSAALIAAVIVIGTPILLRGLRSLFLAHRVTIELLMGIASAGALAIGEAGEALALVLLYTLGEALEARSAAAARRALDALLALQPADAEVLEAGSAHGHGTCADSAHEHAVRRPVAAVRAGERLLVRPGQRIPLDGRIVSGHSAVNQAAITGESMPVERNVGDEVLGGTVNGAGVLVVEVLREAAASTISRIARLVESALAQRSPAERFIDRFAGWYTPAVVLLAVTLVIVAVAGFGQPLLARGGDPGWVYRGLALLIIACPCALVISIPVTVVSALTRLAQLGILVKGGAQLDRLARVRVIAFDKTGTLTTGEPRVTCMQARDCGHEQRAACGSCEELVTVAASVEALSEHPVGRAVVEHARDLGLALAPAAANVQAHAGRGISGEIDGAKIVIGRHELFRHVADCREAVCASAERAQRDGKTVLLVERDREMLGYIGVQDVPRGESTAALAALRALEPRPFIAMLTGDGARAAAAVAGKLGGIDAVHAELLPAEKQQVVRSLRKHGPVAMVGDGINDAPALAQADVGIAMGGSGTAEAIETADIVLMRDDPGAVVQALRLARRTRILVRQNIAASLILKLAVLGLAIPGLATLWGAVLVDVGATLLVTLNGMRLLRAR